MLVRPFCQVHLVAARTLGEQQMGEIPNPVTKSSVAVGALDRVQSADPAQLIDKSPDVRESKFSTPTFRTDHSHKKLFYRLLHTIENKKITLGVLVSTWKLIRVLLSLLSALSS